jgi:hypothetical protein
VSITLDEDEEIVPGLREDGRPDPAYAARLGLIPASAGRRSAAFAIDAAIWVVLMIPAGVGIALVSAAFGVQWQVSRANQGSFLAGLILILVSQVLLAIFGLVQLILHGRLGFTLGKRALGLRSVGVARLSFPGFWRVALRCLVLWGCQVIVPFIGPSLFFASSLWDPERRGRSWLDRVGRTWVIDVRAGLNPLDPKALRHARRTMDAVAAPPRRPLPSLASGSSASDLFVPATRSSSGVVAASAAADSWTPPTVGGESKPPSSAHAGEPREPIPPAQPKPPPATPAAGPLGAAIVLDDGSRIPVAGRILLGRDPAPRSGEHVDRLVPVADPSMRVSKTHLLLASDEHGPWILDRASTNGTSVHRPGRARAELDPETAIRLEHGDVVELGGRHFTIEHSVEGTA